MFRPSAISRFAVAAVLVIGLAGCGSDSDSDTTEDTSDTTATTSAATDSSNPSAAATDTATVAVKGFAYSPVTLTVKAGTTVTWTNEDNVAHTVTSGAARQSDGKFDGRISTQGSTFSYKFTEPGTYPYFCKPHTQMVATVIVTP